MAYLSYYVFFAWIEFCSFVYVVSTCAASNAHWKHHSHFDLLIFGHPSPWDFSRIKIRGVVFVQHLSFCHCFFFFLLLKLKKIGALPDSLHTIWNQDQKKQTSLQQHIIHWSIWLPLEKILLLLNVTPKSIHKP